MASDRYSVRVRDHDGTYLGAIMAEIEADTAPDRRPTMAALRREAVAYYDLCAQARRVGVPVSLDDSRTPQTVAALRRAVADARVVA